MPSKKREIIYYNGQPDGIRSIRKHLSTMTTYVIPRLLLTEAKKIREKGLFLLLDFLFTFYNSLEVKLNISIKPFLLFHHT